TALHDAAKSGHGEVCKLLLEQGALVENADTDGNTPLHEAAYSGDLDTIRLLLQHPAADGSSAAPLRCRTRNKKGQTVLHRAAYWGRAKACRVLLEHGAPVEEEDHKGRTPLQIAKERYHSDVVDALLK
ncbi:ankyrin, partial [Peniophora sp. CONT]